MEKEFKKLLSGKELKAFLKENGVRASDVAREMGIKRQTLNSFFLVNSVSEDVYERVTDALEQVKGRQSQLKYKTYRLLENTSEFISEPNSSYKMSSLVKYLRDLADLKDNSVITEDEFKSLKEKYINDI